MTKQPDNIIHKIVNESKLFPNNSYFPVLIYKNCLTGCSALDVRELFLSNGWKNPWENGIYPFHHYHSNTHEVLGIARGSCNVQLGGESGIIELLEKGDVFIVPAGVAHKNVGCSSDFICVGAYPSEIEYDMNYGTSVEWPKADENIKKVPIPKTDPVYGEKGLLFSYWK